jgi:aspartate carbamoyltransferase catalytic subunit
MKFLQILIQILELHSFVKIKNGLYVRMAILDLVLGGGRGGE